MSEGPTSLQALQSILVTVDGSSIASDRTLDTLEDALMAGAVVDVVTPSESSTDGNGQHAGTPVPALVFDHLGLIVSDLAAGRAFLEGSLGISHWSDVVDDDGLGVSVQFGAAPAGAGPVYELVAPRGQSSPIAGQLGRGKGVLNHLAYRTADLEASAAHLRETGCFATSEPQAAVAYGGALVQFWVSPLRFLIELIAKADHSHSLSGGRTEASQRNPGE